MGSVSKNHDDACVVGEYMLPSITSATTNGNAWERNYHAPPNLKPFVPRKFILNDLRPLMSQPDYTPTQLLQTHGIGVVKHHSRIVDKLGEDQDLDENAINQIYQPEMKELIKNTLGARHVIIQVSILRRGQKQNEDFKLPTQLNKARDLAQDPTNTHKLDNQNGLVVSKPLRTPHIDQSPLGVRQAIRRQDPNIYKIATDCGVIAAEDAICENQEFKATDKASNASIAETYNKSGNAPRYAAYSIWRPLKTVRRDPITISPRREIARTEGKGLVHWMYDNRIPGPEELGGDFLKEYQMLGVDGEAQQQESGDVYGDAKFYYVSRQQPDEVAFIKLFDSFSLGDTSGHMGAPWHGSPEVDGTDGEDARESLELRCFVFW